MYELTKDKYLNEDEMKALRERLESHKLKHPRDTAMIELLIATGARGAEVLNVMPSDLSHKHCSVYIRGLKNSKDREIPIPLPLMQRLKKLSGEGPIFNITTRQLREIWSKYRPNPKKGVHSLRHSAGLNLYQKTKDIKLVQTLLGHRGINNTLIYLEFTSSMEDLRKALVG